MIERFARVAVVIVLAAGCANAQIFPGQSGFAIQNGSDFAGDLCGFNFSCTPDTIDASAGDAISLRVSGMFGAPYLLLISSGAGSCQQFPNVVNSLVLDDPVVITTIGTLDQVSPILACPGGMTSVSGPFPVLPPGFSFGLQVLTVGAGAVASFTVAIVVNVI